jgi:hypothetical protein
LREFVPRDLAAGLDFRGLQRVNSKFHANRRSARRRADVIWRLPTHEDKDLCLYLLIEFQSESDAWMAVRTQVYQGLLWQQVIDESQLQAGARLPALLLLVLYNGERRWKAATGTRELIALSPDSTLWSWQSDLRYCLVDMGRFPKDELARCSSLVSLLFRLEQARSPEGLRELLDEVIGWFQQHEGYDRLRGLFAELIREAFVERGMSLSGLSNLLEVKSMLKENIAKWKKRMRAKARAEARAEAEAEVMARGIAQGRSEGKAEALTSLLAGRFGAIPPSWRKRIQGARLATLERWFKRAIVAPDVTSVFNPRR